MSEHDHNADVERAVLGVLLDGRHTDAMATAAELLPSALAFAHPSHRKIYLGCLNLFAAGLSVDFLAVRAWLQSTPQEEMLGQLKALELLGREVQWKRPAIAYEDSALIHLSGEGDPMQDIMEALAPIGGFKANCAILAEHLRQRRAAAILRQALGVLEGAGGRRDCVKTLSEVVNATSELTGSGQGCTDLGEFGLLALKQHDEAKLQGDSVAGSWGLPVLDDCCRLAAGRLIVLAARPGCGKTSLMLQACCATATANRPGSAAIVSLEMTGQELATIIIAGEIGMPTSTVQRGWMSPEQSLAFFDASEAWKSRQIGIKQSGQKATASDLCGWIRAQHQRGGRQLRLVCVDYLQLMRSENRRANLTDQLGEITKGLKGLAMELGICVLLLSQLSRDQVKEEREPRLTDLRSSGDIEQDADSVLFIYTAANPETQPPSMPVQLILAKQRGGALARHEVVFHRAGGQRFSAPLLKAVNTAMDTPPADDEDYFNS